MTERPRRATIKELAERTGLSPAAVSYALRGVQVSAETVERVREAADEIGYRADPIAQALRGGETGTVGLIVGALSDYWNQELVAALQRRLRASERHLLIADAGGDPLRETELALGLVDRRVDGLIAAPIGPIGEGWAQIAAAVPTVAIGEALPEAATAGEIVFDHERGLLQLLGHLASLGHSAVTVLSWALEAAPGRSVERAVVSAADEIGLEVELVPCPYSLDGAHDLACDLLASQPRPSALLCLTDSIAFGVYAACRDLGLSVPEDVSVAGFADHPLSRLVSPPLTSVDWEIEGIAETALEMLLAALEDRSLSVRTILQAQLRARASTGPAPA